MSDITALSDEDLLRLANAHLQGPVTSDGGKQAAADTPAWQAPFVGAGRVMDRLAAGLRQATPEPIRNAVDALNTKLGMGAPPSIDPAVQQANTNAYTALQQKYPVSTFAGEVGASMAKSPLGMAVLGGLEYGTPTERATHAGFGYAGGKIGEKIGAGISRAFGPESAAGTPRLADEFFPAGGNQWGIPLSVGQQTQSRPAQIVESVLSNLPGSSGVMANARDRTFGAFNRAVGDTFGENTTKLTPEVMGAARERVGGTIGDLASKNSMKFDDPLFNELLRISERAKTELTPEQAGIVVKQMDNIVRDVNPDNMVLAGKLYKAYDSRLGALAKENTGTISNVLGDLRSTLRNAMDRSISPEDAAKWATARKQYMNLMTVADAMKALPGTAAADSLSPASLLRSVNLAQKNAKFGAGNDLAELAQWAKQTLPDKIPNSGTAQRMFYQNLLSNPLTTVGAIGGLGYGADQVGLGKEAALAVPLTYTVARAMAGKPTSASTDELLRRLGVGLLGPTALTYGR